MHECVPSTRPRNALHDRSPQREIKIGSNSYFRSGITAMRRLTSVAGRASKSMKLLFFEFGMTALIIAAAYYVIMAIRVH
jgi:hypothetical protein